MDTTTTAAPAAEATAAPETTTQTQEVKAEAPKEQAAPQLKKFKLKVDGEEFEDEIDLSNEAELVKRFQLAKAAEKRINQAKTEKQKAFEIAKAFEDGTLLKKHPKARELAEKFLLEALEEEMLTDEQKELKSLKTWKQQKDEEEARSKETQAKAAQAAQEKKIVESFQKTIIEALEKSGLPKTPDMAKRAAYLLRKNLELGLNLTSDDLVQEMKAETNSLLKSLIGEATGDQLIEMFGKDVAKKIRAYDVKQLKEKSGMQFEKKQSQPEPTKKTERPQTIEEWKEEVNRRLRG